MRIVFGAWLLTLAACGIAIETLEQPQGEVPCAGIDMGELRLTMGSGALAGRLVLESMQDGTVYRVRWPAGFSAETTNAGAVLRDPDGSIVAHQGDVLQIGGGLSDRETIGVCEVNGVVY